MVLFILTCDVVKPEIYLTAFQRNLLPQQRRHFDHRLLMYCNNGENNLS